MAKPFSISLRTFIFNLQVPSPILTTSMPSHLLKASLAYILFLMISSALLILFAFIKVHFHDVRRNFIGHEAAYVFILLNCIPDKGRGYFHYRRFRYAYVGVVGKFSCIKPRAWVNK